MEKTKGLRRNQEAAKGGRRVKGMETEGPGREAV